MLTDDVIRAVQAAAASPQKLFDEKGLYLLITPGGTRLWRLKYHFPPRSSGNREKLISLGSYPEVSLAQARERRDAARRDIATGIDPSVRRTCERLCVASSFESVAREFIGVLRAASGRLKATILSAASVVAPPCTDRAPGNRARMLLISSSSLSRK